MIELNPFILNPSSLEKVAPKQSPNTKKKLGIKSFSKEPWKPLAKNQGAETETIWKNLGVFDLQRIWAADSLDQNHREGSELSTSHTRHSRSYIMISLKNWAEIESLSLVLPRSLTLPLKKLCFGKAYFRDCVKLQECTWKFKVSQKNSGKTEKHAMINEAIGSLTCQVICSSFQKWDDLWLSWSVNDG